VAPCKPSLSRASARIVATGKNRPQYRRNSHRRLSEARVDDQGSAPQVRRAEAVPDALVVIDPVGTHFRPERRQRLIDVVEEGPVEE
jgi:hypothetical protein